MLPDLQVVGEVKVVATNQGMTVAASGAHPVFNDREEVAAARAQMAAQVSIAANRGTTSC